MTELFEMEKTNLDPGLFVEAKFSTDTIDNLEQFIKEHGIPNATPREKLHTTVVYSKKFVDLPFQTPKFKVNPKGYEWKLLGPENECLVLAFKSRSLKDRFNEAMKLGATYDFDEYIPHVTISYDAKEFDTDSLPLPTFPLEIVDEKQSAINKDWVKEHNTKDLTSFKTML